MNPRTLTEIISATGGEIVGRTRLQKVTYLLEQLGQGEDIHFSYYHYGPYSEEVSSTLDLAKFVDCSIVEREGRRMSDGAPYSIFSLGNQVEIDSVGRIPLPEARRYLNAMQRRNSTVLELAATIHWLRERERVEDWRRELEVRKGAKTANGRAEEAVALLQELGLFAE